MTRGEILSWLREVDPERLERLFRRADRVRREAVGDAVHLRALVEFSNHCGRRCVYCGLRQGNRALPRYRMTADEVLACAEEATAQGIGTIVLQSGDDYAMPAAWLSDAIRRVKARFPLAVTISVGERSEREYRAWRRAGADRVLLKFETSDARLYRKIHPPHDRAAIDRVALLRALRKVGYEIGSGIMVGLAGQTWESLADDLLLIAELDLDMIAIGPYVPHPGTPMGRRYDPAAQAAKGLVPADALTSLKALALARLLVPTANIPATTALSTIDAEGYVLGLRSGANVVMPDLTPLRYRKDYVIYPNPAKSAPEGNLARVREAIRKAGRVVVEGKGERG